MMMRVSKMVFVLAVAAIFAAPLATPSFAKGPSPTGLQHSNKGGAQRGLNRANQVAGVHGQAGRANALSHHKH